MIRHGDRDVNAPNLVELDGSGVHGWLVDEFEFGTAVAYGLHMENSVGWSELDAAAFREAENLDQQLARLGFAVSWPNCWECLAKALAAGRPPGERPSVYDPDLVRAIHQADPGLGRAVLRRAGGWHVAPHDDADFHTTLRLWDTGHDPEETAAAGDEGHWVAYELAGFGRPRRRVEVARCKDCGLPVWVTGLDYLGEHDQWWRRIWPAHTTRTTTSTPPPTSAAAVPVGTTRTTPTPPHDSRRTR